MKFTSSYIANQVSPEGFDEIQQLFMAWHFRIPVALDGPPGVGKTQTVIEMAKLLGLHLYSKACSTRTTESHLISFPVLREKNGVSVTEHQDGPLAKSMALGGVFYGDEFNLLNVDLQKRLNSALDSRRELDRNDGSSIKGSEHFWALISYNPSLEAYERDLEPSVADRFIHISYRRWSANFRAFVAMRAAKGPAKAAEVLPQDYGLKLCLRGISFQSQRFSYNKDKVWLDFFSDEPLEGEPDVCYLVHDEHSLMSQKHNKNKTKEKKLGQGLVDLEFSKALSLFIETIYNISVEGETSYMADFEVRKLLKDENVESLELHQSSTRIETMAMQMVFLLKAIGCPTVLAQSYAVRMVIQQMCCGGYKDQSIGKMSASELLEVIAGSYKLMIHEDKILNLTAKRA